MTARSVTGRIGLIGDPVEHSLSPAFQQPALDALGIEVTYELWQTPAEDIPERIAQLRSGEIYGANVTVPHKEAFFQAVDDVSDTARRAGAVNTILTADGKLYGDNTDVHGFITPLVERAFPFATSAALILGAGGAARAVVVALLDSGIATLRIANRTLPRAEALAQAFDDHRIEVLTLDSAAEATSGVGLVVNATALGWHDELPVPASFFERLDSSVLAYDLTYRDTPFLKAARDAGLATLDGLPMLVHQGARSFELWTGRPAPLDVMLRAAEAARAERV